MSAIAFLFTLAAFGISETAYLIRKRLAAQRPVCIIGGQCGVVLTSPYSRLFFIPNDVLGLLFYCAVAFISALLAIGIEPTAWKLILATLLAGGSAMSVVLVFLQWRVIKAWCFWCVLSAITTWLMTTILFLFLV